MPRKARQDGHLGVVRHCLPHLRLPRRRQPQLKLWQHSGRLAATLVVDLVQGAADGLELALAQVAHRLGKLGVRLRPLRHRPPPNVLNLHVVLAPQPRLLLVAPRLEHGYDGHEIWVRRIVAFEHGQLAVELIEAFVEEPV